MRFDALNDWLQWQETLHPSVIDLGLDRVHPLVQRLNMSNLAHRVITVGGTNGKGSTVAMLESILRAAGYRVGSYTSPHLVRYNERIRIDGAAVSDAVICDSFARIDAERREISLSYFEFGTLAALDIFNRAELDVALLEVGLGGRLDAVNVIDADIAIVTNIALDHRDWLGDDRESIGLEKAGIFRRDRPAICAERAPPESLPQAARNVGARWYALGEHFDYRGHNGAWSWRGQGDGPQRIWKDLPKPALAGSAQLDNASAVLMALSLLEPELTIPAAGIAAGLIGVKLAGRFQVLPGQVETILDVAHNPHAAATLAVNLESYGCRGRTLAVFAILGDKDIAGVAASLKSQVDAWYLAGLQSERGVTAGQLAETLNPVIPAGIPVSTHAVVRDAWRQARSDAVAGDRIVVFGSFLTVGMVIELVDAL